MELDRDTLKTLSAPFGDELEWLPRAPKNGRALALPYIDARAVMNRLDFAVGPGNWSFDWTAIGGDPRKIKGSLTVCGVTKNDAGEADKEDEPLKSAVSDALKRTAVHFGIGRYLYYLPPIWADYDEGKRRFVGQLQIPAAALDQALSLCGVLEAPAQTTQVHQSNGKRRERPPTQAAVERQERPLMEGAPAQPPQDDDAAKVRQGRRLFAVAAEAGLDTENRELIRRIAEIALDAAVPAIKELDAADRATVADWISGHSAAALEIATDMAREAEQKETLPLEETDTTLPAQARGA